MIQIHGDGQEALHLEINYLKIMKNLEKLKVLEF